MSDLPSNPNDVEERVPPGTLRRAFFSLGGFLVFLAVAMFLPAGFDWWNGWLFLVVFMLQMAVAAVYLWRTNPAIYIARRKIHAGTKAWDKMLLSFLLPSFMALFPVAGLEYRFHAASVPTWLMAVGYVLMTVGMAGSVWAEQVNRFAEPGVRIQTERGHKVVDIGPYAIVRHPLYVAGFLLFFGVALALGSYWALVPVTLATLIIVVRTALEDRMLQNELQGYRAYAGRVRYRLIPGIW